MPVSEEVAGALMHLEFLLDSVEILVSHQMHRNSENLRAFVRHRSGPRAHLKVN